MPDLVFSLFEFPAFVCANNIGSLVNSLFGFKIFSPYVSLTSSSPSSGSMEDKTSDFSNHSELSYSISCSAFLFLLGKTLLYQSK